MACWRFNKETCDNLQFMCALVGLIVFFLVAIYIFAIAPYPHKYIFGGIFLVISIACIAWIIYQAKTFHPNSNDSSVISRQETDDVGDSVGPDELQPQPEAPTNSDSSTNTGDDSDVGLQRLRLEGSGSQQDANCLGEMVHHVYNQGAGPSGVGHDVVEYRSDESTMKGIPSISTDDSKRTTPSEEMEVPELSEDGPEKQTADVIAPDSSSPSSESKSKDVPSKGTTPLEEVQVSDASPKLALDGSEKQDADVPKQDSPSSSKSKSD